VTREWVESPGVKMIGSRSVGPIVFIPKVTVDLLEGGSILQ
jgi:hypothetical protein